MVNRNEWSSDALHHPVGYTSDGIKPQLIPTMCGVYKSKNDVPIWFCPKAASIIAKRSKTNEIYKFCIEHFNMVDDGAYEERASLI